MSGPVIVLDGKISKFPYPLYPKNKIPYSHSFRLQIPPIEGEHVFDLVIPAVDLELYNIVVSCTGYKDKDTWSLVADGAYVVMNIYTKEYMQTKPLPVIKKIPPGSTKNKFIFHNNTGTRKIVYLDMDFVIKERLVATESFEIRPTGTRLDVGETYQFRAYYIRDGHETDVTDKCVWSITDFSISQGLVSNTSHTGEATVTATYKNFSSNGAVVVSYSLPSRVIIRMWDNGGEDNDTVNILLDGVQVAEGIVLYNAPNYSDITINMSKGVHTLKIEATRSDSGPCTAGVKIFDINGNQVYEAGYSINVPQQGPLDPPYPYVEWTLEVL